MVFHSLLIMVPHILIHRPMQGTTSSDKWLISVQDFAPHASGGRVIQSVNSPITMTRLFSKKKNILDVRGKNGQRVSVPRRRWAQLADVIRAFVFGIVLGLTSCCVSAQDSTVVEYRYPGGQISSRGALKGGLPAGYWVSFYEDGTRKSEGNWTEGKLDGEWVFYDVRGRVQQTLHYERGMKDGEEQLWDSTGVLSRSRPWVRDSLEGWERVYDGQGVEIQRIPWVSGKKEGIALTFASEDGEQGRIVRRSGYRDDLLRWVEDVNGYDDQGRKSGKWMTFWPNGRVRVEGPWERGLQEGVFKYFSRAGDLERTETYRRGERVLDAPESVALDFRRAYHPNGEVSRTGPWREDVPMGTHRFFDDQGHLVEVKVFREGVLDATGMLDSLGRRTGMWTMFWTDGARRSEGGFLDGKREGPWTFYARDGRVEQEGEYREGEWHGRWRWYHPDGGLHRDERYSRGREQGYFVELSMAGDTLARGEYERGLKQGPWLEHVNDDRREGVYLDGERDGTWRHYYGDGAVRFEGRFLVGIAVGQHVTYWPSGIRASVGDYEGGLQEGNWRYFDASGVVQLVRQYEAGRIVRVNGAKTDR